MSVDTSCNFVSTEAHIRATLKHCLAHQDALIGGARCLTTLPSPTKLMAFRQYKHDISDIVGILREHTHAGNPPTYERIDTAVHNFYNSWDNFPPGTKEILHDILSHEDLDVLYETYATGESTAKTALITFEEQYPDVLQADNLDDILSHLVYLQIKQAVEQ